MRAIFPLVRAGQAESHALVRPRSAAIFALHLGDACRSAGLRLPDDVKDGDGEAVHFYWWLRTRDAKGSYAWAQVDAEGEVVFLLAERGQDGEVASFEAGEGADDEGTPRVPLAECVARVKAFLETSRVASEGGAP